MLSMSKLSNICIAAVIYLCYQATVLQSVYVLRSFFIGTYLSYIKAFVHVHLHNFHSKICRHFFLGTHGDIKVKFIYSGKAPKSLSKI